MPNTATTLSTGDGENVEHLPGTQSVAVEDDYLRELLGIQPIGLGKQAGEESGHVRRDTFWAIRNVSDEVRDKI